MYYEKVCREDKLHNGKGKENREILKGQIFCVYIFG